MEMVLEWVKACPFPYHVVLPRRKDSCGYRVEHEWAVDDGQHYETEQQKNKVEFKLNTQEETDVEQESDIHSDSA